MRLLVITAALAWSAAAWAQTPSDLPTTPTQPEPAPGQGGMWYPGMPVPQPPPQAPARVEKGGDKDKGPQGLILNEEYGPEAGEVSAAPGGPPGAIPETLTVQRGDTLWDISARYYRNPYQWPKLWSYNPAITNPHWIYPGDVIRLVPPGGPPPLEAPKEANLPHRISGRAAPPRGIFLRQTGFVETGELKVAGKIVGSKEEKIMLGTLDEAYVEFPKDHPMQVGERYTIYTPTDEVVHPVTGKKLGTIVEIFGEGEVRAVTDGNIARIAIVDSVNPIERGFLVGPLKRQFKIVQPTTDQADLSGVVVATLHPRELIGTEDIVFVDKGEKDGVAIGNRFRVIRRGDGYQPLLAHLPIDDKRFPRETIAEIVVIDLRDHIATGWVTNAVKEAQVGDRVEARRGF